jgi:hypothetical protein
MAAGWGFGRFRGSGFSGSEVQVQGFRGSRFRGSEETNF